MGLNYNRGKPIKYYSSDRICSLIAGLLTLQKNYTIRFFDNEIHAIYYDDHLDLIEKIKFIPKITSRKK